MALSFAMCASLAFAQTPGTLSRHIPDGIQRSLNLSEMKNKPVDYKASIFSKDDDADTLHCFNFSTADMTGITYGTNAKITASMTINDTTVGNANAHTPIGGATMTLPPLLPLWPTTLLLLQTGTLSMVAVPHSS